MGKRFYIIYCFLCLLCQINIQAQNERFRRYGREEGLSHLSITSLFQDSRGFMWFGTQLGLNCFDGSNIRHFFPDGEDGLPSATINVLTESSDSMLWIGTTRGLAIYDYYHSQFINKSETLSAITGHIVCITPDHDGNMWVIDMKGLHKVFANGKQSRFFPTKDHFVPAHVICANSGRVWVVSHSGDLFLYDATRDKFSCFPILTQEERENAIHPNNLVETTGGSLLITTQRGGVRLFDPATFKVSTLFTNDDNGLPIYIHTVLHRGNDEFWFGTEHGISVYSLRELAFIRHIVKDPSNTASLSDNAVHALYEDRESGIWIGTYFGGVDYLPAGTRDFRTLLPIDSQSKPIANVVREIIPDTRGGLFVGTEDGGLCHYDPSNGLFSSMKGIEWHGKSITNNIQGLLVTGDSLWIGTFDEGLYIYDMRRSSIIAHYYSHSTADGLQSNTIVQIFRTSDDEILIGTMAGMYHYERASQTFVPIAGLRYSFVHCIYETLSHEILVGTFNNGLWQLDRPYQRAVRMPTEYEDLTTIFEDSSNRLWIGTNTHGLFLYDRASRCMKTYDTNLSHPNITICKILEDANGYLWISTSNGLFCLNKSTYEIVRYGLHNSLPTDQFNFNSGYLNAKGEIYIGTLSGMIAFNPTDIQQQKKNYRVFFTDIVQQSSSFSVKYSVPVFSSAQSLWFRYWLNGVDLEPIVAQGLQKVQYNNLTPGHYTLQVEASTINGLWSGHCSTLEFDVPYPPLRSPLALFCYAMATILLTLFFIYHYRRVTRQRRKARIEAVRAELEKEALNDKIKFFTDITHEIRTPLTLINGSLDRLSASESQTVNNDHALPVKNQQTISETLSIMRRNTNRLLGLVNQLLDFRRVEAQSYPLSVRMVDFLKIVTDIYNSFSISAQQKDIRYVLKAEPAACHVMGDAEALTKIVTNMLSNALKYGKSQVTVSLKQTRGTTPSAVLRVSNDGALIPDTELHDIFKPFHQVYHEGENTAINGTGLGLPLARKMAEMQNGTLSYDKSQGENAFVFTLPLTQDDKTPSTAKKNDRPTVLLVDDEIELRHFVSQDISSSYSVIEADNGQQALDILSNQMVNIIVTDIMMPVIDGIELCKRVKNDSRFCHIPVIMLTAKVSLQDHVEALEAHSDAYIEKPFHSQQLLAQIDNLLLGRQLLSKTYAQSPYALTENVARNELDRQLLDSLTQFILVNMQDSGITVEQMAEHVNMSVSTLYRKVKSLTSMSPQEFIRFSKLRRAAELLAEGGRSIKEVAELTGFSSVQYFSSCFMKQFGVTPGKFERKL
ncbi:MAG: response regulator [Bacteroidaceae bacterium]|nr:response regulator [Bacteroidaceae bacterium]